MPGHGFGFALIDLIEESNELLVSTKAVLQTRSPMIAARWLPVDGYQDTCQKQVLVSGGRLESGVACGTRDDVHARLPLPPNTGRDPPWCGRDGHLPFLNQKHGTLPLDPVSRPSTAVGICAEATDALTYQLGIEKGQVEPVIEGPGEGRRGAGPLKLEWDHAAGVADTTAVTGKLPERPPQVQSDQVTA